MSAGAVLMSEELPGISASAMGRLRRSQTAWILVVRPPPLMPMACAFAPLYGMARPFSLMFAG
jgi:hypothetical protein